MEGRQIARKQGGRTISTKSKTTQGRMIVRQTDSQAEIEAREADYTRQAGRNISKRNRRLKGQAER